MAHLTSAPAPVRLEGNWQDHGACRGLPPEMFFHPEGERGTARRQRIETAKAVCASCPVLKQCREQALAVREPYGVWGGLAEDERQRRAARLDLGVA